MPHLKSSLVLLLALTLLTLCGCESRRENAAPSDEAAPAAKIALPLLARPIEPSVVEIPTQALPAWRQFKANAATLVLLSDSPFLRAVPKPLLAAGKELAGSGSVQEIWESGPFASSEPVLLPDMAVRAALENDLFSRIIWVMPVPEEKQPELTLDSLRSYLINASALDEEEAASLTEVPEGFRGTLMGRPFLAAFPSTLPSVEEEAVVHIDSSYFWTLYENEVKTPIFPLVHETLDALRKAGWQTLAVTLSHSNFSGLLPVEGRFLAPTLASLFAEPSILDRGIPRLWALRQENLYLSNFFQPSTSLENALAMVDLAPEDSSTHFDLYKALQTNKQPKAAFASLDRAIELDPAYALSYLDLAGRAMAGGKPEETLRYLLPAADLFPDAPAILLKLAETYLQGGEHARAAELYKRLSQKSWSPIYYPEMPAFISRQLEETLSLSSAAKGER